MTVTIEVRRDNPGDGISVEITEQQLVDLFTKDLPAIRENLGILAAKVGVMWALLIAAIPASLTIAAAALIAVLVR